jgi:hypothetical protein
VVEFGDLDEAAVAGRILAIVRRRQLEVLLLALRLAVGGVGQHVDPHRECIVNPLVDRFGILRRPAGLGELPVTRQVLRRVDDRRAAAILDRPQLAEVGRLGPHPLFHVPERMAGRHLRELVFRLREDRGHQLPKALVEATRITAAGLGEDESTAVDIVAELVGKRLEVERLAAADVKHRRLEQIFDAGVLGIDGLPGEAEFPGLLRVGGEVGRVATVLIPLARRAVFKLGHHDGPPPLGEEQQRERGRHVRLLFDVPIAAPIMG